MLQGISIFISFLLTTFGISLILNFNYNYSAQQETDYLLALPTKNEKIAPSKYALPILDMLSNIQQKIDAGKIAKTLPKQYLYFHSKCYPNEHSEITKVKEHCYLSRMDSALKKKRFNNIINYLIEKNENLNQQISNTKSRYNGYTLLHCAVEYKDLTTVNLLCNQERDESRPDKLKLDVNIKTVQEELTPLHLVFRQYNNINEHIKYVRALNFKSSLNPLLEDAQKQTALHLAIQFEEWDVLKVLFLIIKNNKLTFDENSFFKKITFLQKRNMAHILFKEILG